jgi:type IV pilus assembly protein PilQ
MNTLHPSRYLLGTGLIWLALAAGGLLQTPASAARSDVGPRATVTDQGDRVRVAIESDHPVAYSLSSSAQPPAVVVELPGLTESEGLRRQSVGLPPVTDLTPNRMEKPVPGVQLTVALTQLVFPTVTRDGNALLVDFPKSQKEGAEESKAGASTVAPAPTEASEKSATEVPAATQLQKVEFLPLEQDLTVLFLGDGLFRHDVTLVDAHRLVVDLHDVRASFKGNQIAGKHKLLKQVRMGRHADKVRMVFDLAKPIQYETSAGPGQLALKLREVGSGPNLSARRDDAMGAAQMLAMTAPASQAVQAGPMKEPPSVRTGVIPVALKQALAARPDQPNLAQMAPDDKGPGQAEPSEELGQRRYVGRRISMDFQQADISNVLRLIAEVSGFNIVVGENVKAKVTMKLVGVPWDQALDMLLKMNNLGMIREGNIVWIDSLSNLSRQQDEEAKAKDSKAKAEDLVTEVIYIRNLQAQEVQTTLRPYLTPRGQLNVSPGSNLLVIRDTPSNVSIFRKLVEGLDLEVPQVQIESRIVQADTTYIRSLGIQWGYANLNTLASGKVLNLRGQGGGGSSAVQDAFGSQTSQFLVNLPATVTGLSSVPAVGLTFGTLGADVLDLRLSAGELLNLAKVIAAPKIITLDKREARIEQGESIPFQTISLQGTQTTFVDANLTLQVTPQITSRDPKETSKQILLRVRATRNAVGTRSNPAGPSIDKREATTQVLVRDGETMVIGGIFVDNQTNFSQGVPWLSRIPVIGWFFKSKTESINKQELLIFLTPTIIKT